jgi:hypothetical protein
MVARLALANCEGHRRAAVTCLIILAISLAVALGVCATAAAYENQTSSNPLTREDYDDA